MKKLILAILLMASTSGMALFCNLTQAEIYKDFVPFITLKQIKLNYPNAKFEDKKVAWTNEHEILFFMTGEGLSGTIALKLSKLDKYYTEKLAEFEGKSLNDNSEAVADWVKYYKSQLELPLDERFTLDWVRFVPDLRIPYERLESRYGKAEKCDYLPETFAPFCSWESKGVLVNLTDDKKLVNSIEYNFTNEDMFPSPKTSLKKKSLKPKVKKMSAL